MPSQFSTTFRWYRTKQTIAAVYVIAEHTFMLDQQPYRKPISHTEVWQIVDSDLQLTPIDPAIIPQFCEPFSPPETAAYKQAMRQIEAEFADAASEPITL